MHGRKLRDLCCAHLTAVDVAEVGASKMAPMAAKMSPPLPADEDEDEEELRVTSGGTAASLAGRVGCASVLGSPPPFPAAPPLLLLLLPAAAAAAAGVLVGTATSPSTAKESEMTDPVSAKRVSPAVSSSSSPWPPRMKVPNGSQIQLT
jgi:hypothetical protein